MHTDEIFILGTSRAGSKFYMQLLNTHKEIFVCPELMFKHPIKKDFFTLIQHSIERGDEIERLVDELLAFKERLPYQKIVGEIGREALIDGITELDDVTPYTVFELILQLAATIRGKRIYGAKFPVHFSYAKELLREFPSSKILYLTRDPRAIFVSDYIKKKRESRGEHYRFPIKGFLLRPAVLIYTIREWRSSLKIFESCQKQFSDDRLVLMPYEPVLSDRESVVQQVSSFLNTASEEFDVDKVREVESSYSGRLSADKWKSKIYFYELWIFKLLLRGALRGYGYS